MVLMIEWQVKPLTRTCAVTGQVLEPGQWVTCFLLSDPQGEFLRVDVANEAVSNFVTQNEILARWQRVVKKREDETKALQQQMLNTSEELFLSLSENTTLTEDQEMLRQLLALLLERKRVLKPLTRGRKGAQRFMHMRSKCIFTINLTEIDPFKAVAMEKQLEGILL